MEVKVKTKFNLGDEFYGPDVDSYPKPAAFIVREIHVEWSGTKRFVLRYVADPVSEEIGKDQRRVFLEHQCFNTAEECEENFCKPTRLIQKGIYLPED
jgi:hypothetical protein